MAAPYQIVDAIGMRAGFLVLMTCAAGCWRSSKPEADPTAPIANTAAPQPAPKAADAFGAKLDFAIGGLGEWKTKMCACLDSVCTDKVHEAYKAWENDVLEPMFQGVQESDIPKDKLEVAEKLDDERKECRRRYYTP